MGTVPARSAFAIPGVLYARTKLRPSDGVARTLVRLGAELVDRVPLAAVLPAVRRLEPRLLAVALDEEPDVGALVEGLAALAAIDAPPVLLIGPGEASARALLGRLPGASITVVPTPLRSDVLFALLAQIERQELHRTPAPGARAAAPDPAALARDQRFLLSQATHLAEVGVWGLDRPGGTITWSTEMYLLHGVSPATFVPTATNLLALLHEADRPRLVAAWRDAFRTRELRKGFVYRVATRDGGVRLLRIRGEVLEHPAGGPPSVIGSCQDVTDEQVALGELERANHAFASLLAHASDGVFTLARDGRVLRANHALAGLLGYQDASELAGIDARSFLGGADEIEALFALEGGGRAPRLELRWRRTSGIPVIVEVVGEVRHDGATRTFEGIVRDLTSERERQRRDVDMLAQRQHLELVIEGARLGIWDWDGLSGAYRHNNRLPEILGIPPHECPQEADEWERLVHPDDVASYRDAMARHGRGETPHFEHAYRMRHRDGRWIHVLARGKVVARDAAGNPTRMCGTTTDITSVKETERLAREANEAKTRFLANMSHELRTPLNAVLGLSEALLEGTFGGINQPQLRSLRTIHDSGRHLLALINDILELSRIEEGTLVLEPRRASLARLLDEAIVIVDPLAAAKQQRLVRELEADLPDVALDHRRMLQVLINLLGNAVKFSPSGTEVTLAARAVPGEDAVELEVRDLGPGVPAEDQERIFERFVTLEPTLTKDRSGAGLGLALARRIVELHRGSLRVKSSPGHGSSFIARLPSGPRDGAALAHDGGAPGTDAGVPALPQVLLAEDNEANIITTQTYLEALGYSVRVARDGLSAVEAAATPGLDVIVMDIQLPRLGGLEAIRRIRERAGGPAKVIIAVTANAMPGDDQRCLAAGADAYLAKPVRLRSLASTILQHTRAGATEAP